METKIVKINGEYKVSIIESNQTFYIDYTDGTKKSAKFFKKMFDIALEKHNEEIEIKCRSTKEIVLF